MDKTFIFRFIKVAGFFLKKVTTSIYTPKMLMYTVWLQLGVVSLNTLHVAHSNLKSITVNWSIAQPTIYKCVHDLWWCCVWQTLYVCCVALNSALYSVGGVDWNGSVWCTHSLQAGHALLYETCWRTPIKNLQFFEDYRGDQMSLILSIHLSVCLSVCLSFA